MSTEPHLQRNLPELKGMFLDMIIGRKKATPKNYLLGIEKFERYCEHELKTTFRRVNIRGIVKTDPYSLPYNHEIKVKLHGTGFSDGFAFYEVTRPILQELFSKEVYKLRFYFFVNIHTSLNTEFNKIDWWVEYAFRYHLPDQSIYQSAGT